MIYCVALIYDQETNLFQKHICVEAVGNDIGPPEKFEMKDGGH